jgi:abortive infection bacteriophage resistance protein
MEYTKSSLTYEQQADLIISRGMVCDREDLISKLKSVGYYRLSGYWHTFKKEGNDFRPNTNFTDVWNTYTFDRQLRLSVLDAIERIEIWLRASLAYALSQQGGSFGYTQKMNLPDFNEEAYAKLIARCENEYKRSKEQYIEHFKKQYGDKHNLPPYWMLVGTMDFGQIFKLYKGAPKDTQKHIASQINVMPQILNSWLVSLGATRNICAHHARLWNRELGAKPKIPKDSIWHKPYDITSKKVFGTLSILSFLLETVAPNTKWRNRLFDLFAQYPSVPNKQMGFLSGWKESPIWKKWTK